MFKTNNEKIGKHLGNLIKNSEHKNDRQFCIAYLTLRDGEANPDDIQKMQNRICQIKNGKKGVQIEDLPIFSDLLGVSIEDILSATAFHYYIIIVIIFCSNNNPLGILSFPKRANTIIWSYNFICWVRHLITKIVFK